jgi:hypothetical protein
MAQRLAIVALNKRSRQLSLGLLPLFGSARRRGRSALKTTSKWNYGLTVYRVLWTLSSLFLFYVGSLWGIRLGRDNWVSVRYAGELNSGTSSVLLQRTDRHGILGEKPPDFQVSL